MHPYRTADHSATPRRCFLNPLGPAVVLEQVHYGVLFEVFRVQVGERIYAVKSPRRAPPSEKDIIGWVTTGYFFGASAWFIGGTGQQSYSPSLWPWLSFALLCAEAEHVRSTGERWNHGVVTLGMWDEGDFAHLGCREQTPPQRLDQRFRPALIMPWHEGQDLSALPLDEQRALFPLMLPALWDSLLAARHRDLSPSNLRLLPDGRRFVLLDPGVHLASYGTGKPRNDSKCDDLEFFITNARTYPLLPPNAPSCMIAGAQAREFWATGTPVEPHELAALLACGSLVLRDAQDFEGGRAETRTIFPHDANRSVPPGWLKSAGDRVIPRPGPPPADWLAVGVMYFEILTQRHPFYRDDFDVPGWCGKLFEDWLCADRSVTSDPEFPRWAERCRDTLASVRYLSDAERKLAMSLLSLSFTSREQLVAAVVAVLEARGDSPPWR
jgi:hypothetical protein